MSYTFNAVLRLFRDRPTTTAVFKVVKDNGCYCTATRSTGAICEMHYRAARGKYA